MKPIPGFPGYKITDDGRVWSEGRMGTRGGWLLPHTNHAGRLVVTLCERGYKQKTRFISRLVLETFVSPCPPGMEACHDPDRNPVNNRLENLRWDTRSENQKDAIRHGTHVSFMMHGEQNGSAKLTELDVRWIEYLRRAGVRRKDLAEVYRVSVSLIGQIGRHEIWRYLWT